MQARCRDVAIQAVHGGRKALSRAVSVELAEHAVQDEMIVTKDGRETPFAVGEGLVAVTGERVEILTDMAIRAEDIDEAEVEEARQRAAARLQETLSDEEVAASTRRS
jgi:F0F1-type ATP synthase epsilon subunit